MKVYLAGKIRKHCWRHDVVRDLRNEDWVTGEHPGESWPVLENAVVGGFDYAGPFFTSCDHGCAHRKPDGGLHGLSAEVCVRPAPRAVVRDLCLAAIRRADVVFAWIDAADCYGTIAELGYAYALGKVVFVAFAEGFDPSEMWFIQECSHFYGWWDDPAEALRDLRSLLDSRGAAALRCGWWDESRPWAPGSGPQGRKPLREEVRARQTALAKVIDDGAGKAQGG